MHNELQAEIQVTHSFNDDPETFGTQCPIFALITFTYVKFFSFAFLIPLVVYLVEKSTVLTLWSLRQSSEQPMGQAEQTALKIIL